jgi:hypothetical protein
MVVRKYDESISELFQNDHHISKVRIHTVPWVS